MKLMSKIITIGKWDAKICATCEFWEGTNQLHSAEVHSNPNKMILADSAKTTYGICIKKHSQKSGTQSCSSHAYSYRLQRYVK